MVLDAQSRLEIPGATPDSQEGTIGRDAREDASLLLECAREEAFGERKQVPNQPDVRYSDPVPFLRGYEIPESDRVSTLWKGITYWTNIWSFGLTGAFGTACMTRNPYVRVGGTLLTAMAGLSNAKDAIHGRELQGLKIKESVNLPKV